MIKLLNKSITWSLSVISIIFTFVPEIIFEKYKFLLNFSDEINVIINRILVFIDVSVLVGILNMLYLFCKKSICIKGHNYSIKVEYGDLLKMNNCKKVISFDECFTTSVGDYPAEIKPTSICGQYLQRNPIQNMQSLIDTVQLKPSKSKSKYQNKVRYESGRLVPSGYCLLLAFAKLDEEGLGKIFSIDEFLDCLSLLWKEIDKYYGQKDVCIPPILGTGITRINNTYLTQREVPDIIVGSYKLSPHKIKDPYQLHIV